MTIQVRVRNFQSIEDASIVIDGLTVITGTNNAGKSALFRAVRGAFTNARGHAFVRSRQSHCTVDLKFEDGQTLTWEKGKNVNTYVVNGKAFKKVDRGVPPEVRAFGVEPISAGDKELWPQIAPQMTGVVFLLNEPGSVVAEAVADVERVNQLTNALRECDADRRSVRADLKARTETSTSLAEQRTHFAGLDLVVDGLTDLDKRFEVGVRVEKAIANLEKLATRHRTANSDVDSLRGVDDVACLVTSEEVVGEASRVGSELRRLRALRDHHATAREACASLEGCGVVAAQLPSEERVAYVAKFRQGIGVTVDLVSRYDRAQEELERATEAGAALASVRLNDELVERLQKFTKGLQAARQLWNRFAQASSEARGILADLDEATARKDGADAEVRRLLGDGECPTCGQRVVDSA